MNTSIFLAKLFGFYFIIMSIVLLTRRQHLISAAMAMMESPSVLLLAAVMTTIMGLLLVLFHNIWVMGWPVFITIVSWLTLIKGVVLLVKPGIYDPFMVTFQSTRFFYGIILLNLLFGVFLTWMGFTA